MLERVATLEAENAALERQAEKLKNGYTGIDDIDGNEIWSGHVVSCDYRKNGGTVCRSRVEWRNKTMAYHLVDTCTSRLSKWSVQKYRLQVVGKYHENPDLLEGKQDAATI
jgi:hypothetical protein